MQLRLGLQLGRLGKSSLQGLSVAEQLTIPAQAGVGVDARRAHVEPDLRLLAPRVGAALEGSTISSALKQQIANFKVPKQVYVVAELPRNTMGKVQKNLLREQYKSLFA